MLASRRRSLDEDFLTTHSPRLIWHPISTRRDKGLTGAGRRVKVSRRIVYDTASLHAAEDAAPSPFIEAATHVFPGYDGGEITLNIPHFAPLPYPSLQAYLATEEIPVDASRDPGGALARRGALMQFVHDFTAAFETAREGRSGPDPDISRAFHEWQRFLEIAPGYPRGAFAGRGIVIPGGGVVYIISVYVNVRLLRFLGCRLPIEVWMLENEVPGDELRQLLSDLGATIRSAAEIEGGARALLTATGFTFKAASVVLSSFEEVILLDADVNPVQDPTSLLDDPHYRSTGVMMWKDYWKLDPRLFGDVRAAFNLTAQDIKAWAGGNSGAYPGSYQMDAGGDDGRFFAPSEFTYDRVRVEHRRSGAQ